MPRQIHCLQGCLAVPVMFWSCLNIALPPRGNFFDQNGTIAPTMGLWLRSLAIAFGPLEALCDHTGLQLLSVYVRTASDGLFRPGFLHEDRDVKGIEAPSGLLDCRCNPIVCFLRLTVEADLSGACVIRFFDFENGGFGVMDKLSYFTNSLLPETPYFSRGTRVAVHSLPPQQPVRKQAG